MTTSQLLSACTASLEAAGISTARLDCLVLMEDMLDRDRSWILAHPDKPIADDLAEVLQKRVERRAGHEPLAYIRGRTEFYGRDFIVSPATLEPRPETETMIDLCKQLVASDKTLSDAIIADIGTGSGAIAATIALELPGTEVHATEINQDAYEIALKNIKKHAVDVHAALGDLLMPLMANNVSPEILLCNLPYVPDSHTINQAAMQEPAVAIFGGADGLDHYRKLFQQIKSMHVNPRYVLTESLPFQHEALAAIAAENGYKQIEDVDFIQSFEFSGLLLETTAEHDSN